jgi:hypothetical protein
MFLGHRLAAALLLTLLPVAPGVTHHGWAWATGEEFQLAGVARQVRNGNPHGMMMLATASGIWRVEIGQPWRNQRAGLTNEVLKPGAQLVVRGHRSARRGERLMKAERIIIGGKSYNLYPDRPS